jgi:hypothetical protein
VRSTIIIINVISTGFVPDQRCFKLRIYMRYNDLKCRAHQPIHWPAFYRSRIGIVKLLYLRSYFKRLYKYYITIGEFSGILHKPVIFLDFKEAIFLIGKISFAFGDLLTDSILDKYFNYENFDRDNFL